MSVRLLQLPLWKRALVSAVLKQRPQDKKKTRSLAAWIDRGAGLGGLELQEARGGRAARDAGRVRDAARGDAVSLAASR